MRIEEYCAQRFEFLHGFTARFPDQLADPVFDDVSTLGQTDQQGLFRGFAMIDLFEHPHRALKKYVCLFGGLSFLIPAFQRHQQRQIGIAFESSPVCLGVDAPAFCDEVVVFDIQHQPVSGKNRLIPGFYLCPNNLACRITNTAHARDAFQRFLRRDELRRFQPVICFIHLAVNHPETWATLDVVPQKKNSLLLFDFLNRCVDTFRQHGHLLGQCAFKVALEYAAGRFLVSIFSQCKFADDPLRVLGKILVTRYLLMPPVFPAFPVDRGCFRQND